MSNANSQNQCRKQGYVYKSAENEGGQSSEFEGVWCVQIMGSCFRPMINTFLLPLCVQVHSYAGELNTLSIKAEDDELVFKVFTGNNWETVKTVLDNKFNESGYKSINEGLTEGVKIAN